MLRSDLRIERNSPLVTVSGTATGAAARCAPLVWPLGGAPAVSMRAHGLPLLCLVSEAGRSSLRAKQLLARSSLHARRHAASPPPVCQAAAARSEGSSGRLRPTTPLLPESIAAPAASPAPPAPDAQAGLQPPRSRPRAEGVPFLRLRGAGRAGARPTRRAARGIPASASPSAEAPPRPRARAARRGPWGNEARSDAVCAGATLRLEVLVPCRLEGGTPWLLGGPERPGSAAFGPWGSLLFGL